MAGQTPIQETLKPEPGQKSPGDSGWHWLSDRRTFVGGALVLVLLVGAGAYAWHAGRSLEGMAALGYPGIFLVMLLSGASTFLPIGGQAAVMAAGSLWNPLLVGLAAGLGNATGELVGYGAGLVGASVLERKPLPGWWLLLRRWLHRYGFFTILVLAVVPNPVFDAVGILAGSMGYPIRRLWLACVLGNSVKYVLVAYLGEAVSWFLR